MIDDFDEVLLDAQKATAQGSLEARVGSVLQRVTAGQAAAGAAGVLALLTLGVWSFWPASKSAGGSVKTAGGNELQATGLLLQAVRNQAFEPITWIDQLGPGGITFTAAADNLRAGVGDDNQLLRLGVSYDESIQIARELYQQTGIPMIVASQRLADAIYQNAPIKTVFQPLVLQPSDSLHMQSVDFAKKLNASVDSQIQAKGGTPGTSQSAGSEKYWLLHARLKPEVNKEFLSRTNMVPKGKYQAVNYGAWKSDGTLYQSPGTDHDYAHFGEYSQLFRPIKRYAKAADGSTLDLLTWIENAENVDPQFTNAFRFDSITTS